MHTMTTRRARRWTLGAAAALLLAGLVPTQGATAAGPPAKDPCGATIARPTGGTWTCTFADSFSGRSLDTSRWVTVKTSANGFHSGAECFVDSPDNVAVANGVLRLTVRKEAQPFVCASPLGSYPTQYTGGYVTTWSKFSQTYGRFEIRARFPAGTGPGVHSALWLYPVNPARYGTWPVSGEIDIAEFYSTYPDRAVPYVHYARDAEDPNATNNNCLLDDPTAFHTYVLEWTPQTLTVSFDGKVCILDDWLTTPGLPDTAPFDQPFHLNLTQALGVFANGVTGSTVLPASMLVDHVRVWR